MADEAKAQSAKRKFKRGDEGREQMTNSYRDRAKERRPIARRCLPGGSLGGGGFEGYDQRGRKGGKGGSIHVGSFEARVVV